MIKQQYSNIFTGNIRSYIFLIKRMKDIFYIFVSKYKRKMYPSISYITLKYNNNLVA